MPIARIRCPNPECARELWDDKQAHTPEAGDLNVCLYCLQVMRYTSATEARCESPDALDPQTQAMRVVASRICLYCMRPHRDCIAARKCGRVRPPGIPSN